MRDILIGLSAGFVVGAYLARNYRPCADAVDCVTEAAEKKMKAMEKKKKTATQKSQTEAEA